jgi:hypothetical protein
MRYLRLFESFQTESEVAKICRKYGITYWTLNNGLVDVDAYVDLTNRKLTKLPLKFGNVTDGFYCNRNQLTSLEGSPHTVGGDFYCNVNQLTSLEGGPKEVGGNFYCEDNQLISFEGSKKIRGYFVCGNNPLESVWDLITPNNKWNNQVMELLNDYDCLRGMDIILDRFNDFLQEIGRSPVESVEGYNNI